MSGAVQHYTWGDQWFIPALLDVPADGRPWAEMWFGTHPSAPSTVDDGTMLSSVTGDLPYLLKVLAAGRPLSLQTHPSPEQAVAGFAREETAGVARDAPTRIYRDPFAKPELICALTPFDALCGFRPIDASVAVLQRLGLDGLAAQLRSEGLPAVVTGLYRGEIALGPIVDACTAHAFSEARMVTELALQYPGDPSVAVTLLMHRVQLAPGEAIYLGPGNLHAYLSGSGVEVMAASDNVVRGGMTDKHVDVDELLAVLDIRSIADPRVRPVEGPDGWWRYDTPDTPFRLWRLEIAGRTSVTAVGRELVLCVDGATDQLERGAVLVLSPGESLAFTGIATLFRVEEVVTATTA